MEKNYITITNKNIDIQHICCAFSDKKCAEGYELKKKWLKGELENGYVFKRLDARAKVFIEYVPAEKAWIPVDAPNYLMINCFWVSGQYKGKGHAKALFQSAIADAESQGKNGLVTVVGTKKYHYMSDTKWLLRQGFETVEETSSGFSLLSLKIKKGALNPSFKDSVRDGKCPDKEGIVVYYTNRCPFTEYYVRNSLENLARLHGVPLKVIKLETCEQAQNSPTPATIFSLFYNGEFVTTDLSICVEKRFEKIMLQKK